MSNEQETPTEQLRPGDGAQPASRHPEPSATPAGCHPEASATPAGCHPEASATPAGCHPERAQRVEGSSAAPAEDAPAAADVSRETLVANTCDNGTNVSRETFDPAPDHAPEAPVGAGCCPPTSAQQGAPTKSSSQGSAPTPNKRRTLLLAVLVVLLLAAVAASLWFCNRPADEGLAPDPNVRVGSVTGSTADLDKIVDEGMLTFSINSTPVFDDGRSPGNLMIENPDINNNRFTVEITRDDTGETVYKSGALDPGQYIDGVPLDVNLTAGEYVCTATFSTFRLADDSPIGQAAAGIKITVLN